MPRNNGIYSPPSGTQGVPLTSISSAAYNSFVDDLTNDLNNARPVIAGGTGATTAAGALANLAGGASGLHAIGDKATPADVDELALVDSTDSWSLKKLTWANIKAALSSVLLPLAGGKMAGDLDMDGHNILNSDAWAFQPIGVPIPLSDNLAGVAAPPTDKDYRYIKLTVSDAYNTGVLTGESVSGSAPLVIATAVVDLGGSPLDGSTIHLINTERRFLRAGAAGTMQEDAMQRLTGQIGTDGFERALSGPTNTFGAFTPKPPLGSYFSLGSGSGTVSNTSSKIEFDTGNSPDARVSDVETRVKNIGVTYFMRVK